MSDVAFRAHEEKQEAGCIESMQKRPSESSEVDEAAAPRAARQDAVVPCEARGEALPREGSNLAAKRAMAAELIGMGFSKAQACRILHLTRRELGKRRAAGGDKRQAGRSK